VLAKGIGPKSVLISTIPSIRAPRPGRGAYPDRGSGPESPRFQHNVITHYVTNPGWMQPLCFLKAAFREKT
jgi:hypothetical protein